MTGVVIFSLGPSPFVYPFKGRVGHVVAGTLLWPLEHIVDRMRDDGDT